MHFEGGIHVEQVTIYLSKAHVIRNYSTIYTEDSIELVTYE